MLSTHNNVSYTDIGKITCFLTFIFGVGYLLITGLGFLSLASPDDPIGDPYFTLMEVCTIIIAFLMVMNMITIHYYASEKYKSHSLFAICCMVIMAGITSSVHFVILAMQHHIETSTTPELALFFSFKWPSVVYALDILAWDVFFSLSFIAAAPVFNQGRREKLVRVLMLISGTLSLIGILGVPFGNMQIRNIGIIGYALFAPLSFLFIGRIFNRIQLDQEANGLQ